MRLLYVREYSLINVIQSRIFIDAILKFLIPCLLAGVKRLITLSLSKFIFNIVNIYIIYRKSFNFLCAQLYTNNQPCCCLGYLTLNMYADL